MAALAYVGTEAVLAGVALGVTATHGLAGPVIAVVVTTVALVGAAAACGALGPGAGAEVTV